MATAPTVIARPRRSFSLAQSERLLGFAMLTPAFALLALVVVYPVVTLLITSFYEVDQGTPAHRAPFIGFENYQRAFEDGRFWTSSLNTLLYAAISVPGALVVGLGLALLANRPYRVKWPVRLGLLLPWALPVVFAGLIFRWFFDYQQGIVNDVIVRLGFEAPQWLSSPTLATIAISIALVWKTSSFVALVLLAGLQTISSEFYEAAEVDGATPWQQFWHVTLPLLTPIIAVVMTFSVLFTFTDFQLIYVLTRGGPLNATHLMATLSFQRAISGGALGEGAAIATAMVPFLLAAILFSFFGLQRRGWQQGNDK